MLGLLIFAVTSVNGQILKDLEQYQYTYTQTDQLDQAIKEAIINSISLIGSEKYIHDITSIEVAACTKKKNLKDFIKKARKIIKKEKISQLQSTINDDMTCLERQQATDSSTHARPFPPCKGLCPYR